MMNVKSRNLNTLSDYLNLARGLKEQERFGEALQILREALKFRQFLSEPDTSNEEDKALIDALRQEIEEKRTQRTQDLTLQVEQLLAIKSDAMTLAQLKGGQEVLALLQTIHPDPVDYEMLATRWRAHYDDARMALELDETRRKLEELWDAPYSALSKYDEALALARQKTLAHPDELQFQELHRYAEERRKEAYHLEGRITTFFAEGKFKEAIDELRRLEEGGVESLPLYDWGLVKIDNKPQRGLVAGRDVRPDLAIEAASELAREYETSKAEEYIQQARASLPVDPESAKNKIEAAKKFEFIERFTKDELENVSKQEIAPALSKRKQAKELVEEAKKSHRDVADAWSYLDQAALVDPYAPEIGQARDSIRPFLKKHLEGQMQQAIEVRKAGNFETAREMAIAVEGIAASDEPLSEVAQNARSLIAGCNADQVLYHQTLPSAVNEITSLVDSNLSAAEKKLTELEATLAGRAERFGQLIEPARQAVQDRQSLEDLLVGWETRFRKQNPLQFNTSETLRAAREKLNELDHECEVTKGKRRRQKELVEFQERVQARRAFVQGRLDWEVGLYDKAKIAWLQVAQQRDDYQLAQEWLRRAEDATAVSNAIEQAEIYRAEKKYQEAINLLSQWRTKASPKRREAYELYYKIEREWIQSLEQEIKRLLEALEYNPDYSGLVEKIEQLAKLDPAKARLYQAKHLVPIYEEWGDFAYRRGLYDKAKENYDSAIKLAHGQPRLGLESKWLKAHRRLVHRQVDDHWAKDERDAARSLLLELLNKNSNDVPSLARLADLFLASEESERASNYLKQAGRRRQAAVREGDPTIAGLEEREELTEWRFRVDTLLKKADAVSSIHQAKKNIKQKLQPTSSLREYRMARQAKDGLLNQLKESAQEIVAQKESDLSSLSQNAQERVLREGMTLQGWLKLQLRDGAGVEKWYEEYVLEVLKLLREEWKQTTEHDIERLDFRENKLLSDLRKRWQIGLKISLLFSDSEESRMALREVTDAQQKLKQFVSKFTKDEKGPDYDLGNKKLEPLAALETQIGWSEKVRTWVLFLSELLSHYAWAVQGKPENRVNGSNQDLHKMRNQVEVFRKQLSALLMEIEHSYDRLMQAVATGQGRWQLLSWSKIIEHMLYSPHVLSLMDSKNAQVNRYWQRLQHNNIETRWFAWQEAAQLLRQAGFMNNPQMGPWTEINQLIVQADIYEEWKEVTTPLAESMKRFGQHRAVKSVLNERQAKKRKRDQLVLAVAELITLVKADEFLAALGQMQQIETLDPQDEYGFRIGSLIEPPQSSAWKELQANLEESQKQWEIYQAWWDQVEKSALPQWQESKRAEVIERSRQAEFQMAIALCEDAFSGKQAEGKTNQLGGGLALSPLLVLLETPPAELKAPRSERLRLALRNVDQWKHDAQEAVDELNFWLGHSEEEGHRPQEISEPLSKRQAKFKGSKDQLEGGLTSLLGRWRFWQRSEKEQQRKYCKQLLADLRHIVPEWEKLDMYQRDIEEA